MKVILCTFQGSFVDKVYGWKEKKKANQHLKQLFNKKYRF